MKFIKKFYFTMLARDNGWEYVHCDSDDITVKKSVVLPNKFKNTLVLYYNFKTKLVVYTLIIPTSMKECRVDNLEYKLRKHQSFSTFIRFPFLLVLMSKKGGYDG